jgi:hypothetical protein
VNARRFLGFTTRFVCACGVATALSACGPKLDLGSNVLWATNHEKGNVSDWLLAPGGGVSTDTTTGTVEVVAGPAHSGRYSLELIDLATSDDDGPYVYRELVSPPDAYYSAWYYIPRQYVTNSQWTIQEFRFRSDSDGTVIARGHDLNLGALPGGQYVLTVFSHDSNYLQAPLSDPPPLIPVATWFQVETLYRSRNDDTGELKVWLDDRLVYDLENRRTGLSSDLLWTPSNIAEDVEPAPPVVYIDDAAISLERVTRSGQLFASP